MKLLLLKKQTGLVLPSPAVPQVAFGVASTGKSIDRQEVFKDEPLYYRHLPHARLDRDRVDNTLALD
jgi:hypothetical protein